MAKKREVVSPVDDKKPNRKGHVDSFYMSPEVYTAFNAYMASKEVKEKKTSIFDYAMKLFLAERGFWPWPKPE